MDKLLAAESRQSLTESSQSSEVRKLHATRCAKILLGCYRTGDANDPEIYVSSVIGILQRYPVDIIERVCSPIEGLPARLKWLPSLSEIRDECEAHMGHVRRVEQLSQWDERAKKQIEERDRLDAERTRRPTLEELHAKYDGPNGEPWGISVERKQRISTREEAAKSLIAKIGKEAFDAIPDSPAADYRA